MRLDHLLSKEILEFLRSATIEMRNSHLMHWSALGRRFVRRLGRVFSFVLRERCSSFVSIRERMEQRSFQRQRRVVRPLRPLRTALQAHAFFSVFCFSSPTTGTIGNHWKPSSENLGKSLNNSNSQATKGQRWMPWRLLPMKDVTGCDKPR